MLLSLTLILLPFLKPRELEDSLTCLAWNVVRKQQSYAEVALLRKAVSVISPSTSLPPRTRQDWCHSFPGKLRLKIYIFLIDVCFSHINECSIRYEKCEGVVRGELDRDVNLSISIISIKESIIRKGDFHRTEFKLKPVWRMSSVIHAELVYPALFRWVAVSPSQCILGAETSLTFELAKYHSAANSVK